MKTAETDITARLEAFKQTAKANGVKVTHQRLEIFKEIVSSDAHPSAEAIYSAIKPKLQTISLDTVYRTLWLFTDLGLITTLGLRRDCVHFDANLDRHHHFICTRCGLTKDFYSESLDSLTLPHQAAELGIVENTHVELHGVCKSCARKEATLQANG